MTNFVPIFRRNIKPLHFVIITASIILGGLLLFLLVRLLLPAPIAELDNQMPQLGNFVVNAKAVTAFLERQGYTDRVSRARLIYTDSPSKVFFGQAAADGSTLYSIGSTLKEGVVTVELHYNPDHFDDIKTNAQWQSADFLTGICLALTDIRPETIDGCYQVVRDFILWATDNDLPLPITAAPQMGWRLVSPVYAGCNGTIPCGRSVRTCTCSNSGLSCNPASGCNDDRDTCTCGDYYCDTSFDILNCSSQVSRDVCLGCNGGFHCCDNQCDENLSGPRPDPGIMCTWTFPPPPGSTPPPPPGVTSPPGTLPPTPIVAEVFLPRL